MTSNPNDRKNVSKHILPTSSNLLGICFVILSFIKLWKMGRLEVIITDKLIGISIVLFLVASLFSYASMRSDRKSEFYEKIADMFFLAGLSFLTVIALIMAFEIL